MFKTLSNGLRVLEILAQSPTPMTSSQLSAETGIARSTMQRLVHALEELGYVRFKGRFVASTAKCLQLASAYAVRDQLVERALPVMNFLMTTIDETVSLAVLESFEAVYVARVRAPQRVQYDVEVGTRLPAHSCSTGRVLMASQPVSFVNSYFHYVTPVRYTDKTITDPVELRREIREVGQTGLAEVVGEMDESIHGLAIPVYRDGTVIAALGLTTSRGRMTEALRNKYVSHLRLGAARIANDGAAAGGA